MARHNPVSFYRFSKLVNENPISAKYLTEKEYLAEYESIALSRPDKNEGKAKN